MDTQDAFLRGMMAMPIATLPPAVASWTSSAKNLSTKSVRFEESRMASWLLSLVKRGLKGQGVQVAMIQVLIQVLPRAQRAGCGGGVKPSPRRALENAPPFLVPLAASDLGGVPFKCLFMRGL